MLVGKCRYSQLQYAFSLVDDKIPITHVDFTRRLPRVVSVYIFSFLDPRSLCRCAQVCWYWKFLSELDQIWLPKCLKFGWLLSFVPSPFEHGVWKRHYLESVRGLQYIRPKVGHKYCTVKIKLSVPMKVCCPSSLVHFPFEDYRSVVSLTWWRQQLVVKLRVLHAS